MTVAELKEMLKDLPDNALVGVIGHFGEVLCPDKDLCRFHEPGSQCGGETGVFEVEYVDIGPVPD